MGKDLTKTRGQLKVFAAEWFAETYDAVSGRILRVKSDKLRQSLRIVDNTKDDPPTIEITADAVSGRGFPYAAWHEFGSGRSYIRPSLLYLLSKQGTTKSGLKRAMIADVTEGVIEDLIQRGWAPGVLPNSAVRTVAISMAGKGTTGHLRRGFTSRALKASLRPQHLQGLGHQGIIRDVRGRFAPER